MLRLFLSAIVILMSLTVVGTRPMQAQTFNVIHTFTGGQDGAYPEAGVTLDNAGNLYGTASGGGLHHDGTVYQLKHTGSAWTFNPLYNFNGDDGASPQARVIFGPNGTLYGTTTYGGTRDDGTVFNLRPSPRACTAVLCPWTETVLYGFMPGVDGTVPYGDLVFDQAGNLYGTTEDGGLYAQGTVYELTPSGSTWTESVLYNFSGSYGSGNDGANPASGVIFDNAGNLYGTTSGGGLFGFGTIFQLTPSGPGWKENILYNFPERKRRRRSHRRPDI